MIAQLRPGHDRCPTGRSAYRWDIVLRGPDATPPRRRLMERHPTTPSQTVGPFFAIGLPWSDGPDVVAERHARRVLDPRHACYDGAGEPVPDALDRDLAGGPGRALRPPDRPARPRRAGSAASAARQPTRRAAGGVRTVKPGRCPTPTAAAGAAPRRDGVRPRPARPRRRRGSTSPTRRRRTRADPVLARVATPAARDADRPAPSDDGYHFDIRLQGTVRRSSSPSETRRAAGSFDGVLARGACARRSATRAGCRRCSTSRRRWPAPRPRPG